MVCKVGWGHKDRGGYLDQRDPSVHRVHLAQLALMVDKALWVPREPLVFWVLQEYRGHQDTRESRETLS